MKTLMRRFTALLTALVMVLGVLTLSGCGGEKKSGSDDLEEALEEALEALEDGDYDTVVELIEDNDDLAEEKDLIKAVKKHIKNLASEYEDGELDEDEVAEALEDMEDLLEALDDDELKELAEELAESLGNSGNGGNSGELPAQPMETQPAQPPETQPPATEPPQEVRNVTITVWMSWEDQQDWDSWLLVMEQMFAEEHPEYYFTFHNEVVEPYEMGNVVSYDPQAAADVYMYANDQLGTLVEAGGLACLSGNALRQVQGSFSDTYLNSVSYSDGNVYGFPMEPNTWFMYYNKSILSEEDVKSLEACLEKGVVAFPVRDAWYLSSWFFAAGGTLFGENGTDARAGVQFGGQVGENAMEALLTAVEHPNFRVDADGYGVYGMQEGTVAAYFSGSWDYQQLYAALGENLGAVPAPTVMIDGVPSQLKAYAGTKAIGVNPYSENLSLSMEFAAFLASEESQLIRFQLHGNTPAVSALAEHPDIQNSLVANAQALTMLYASVSQPTIPQMINVWGPIGDLGTMFANGEVTRSNMKEVLAEIIAILENIS